MHFPSRVIIMQYGGETPVTAVIKFLHMILVLPFACTAVPCVLRCQAITSTASAVYWREGGLQVRSFCSLQTIWGLQEKSDFAGLYTAVDDAGSAPALEVRTAPPCHLKHSIFSRRNVWFLLSRSWQLLPNFIKTSVLGLCSCRGRKRKHLIRKRIIL